MSEVSTVEPSTNGLSDLAGSTSADIQPGRPARLRRAVLAHPVLTTFVVAIGLRFVLATSIWFVNGGVLFGDESTFSGMAAVRAGGKPPWWDDFLDRLYWGTGTFTVPMTLLFKVFGPITLLGQMLAAAYAATAAALTARLASEWARPAVALAAGLVVALMPSQVLFSILILKDSGVWATLAGLALVVLLWNRAQGWQIVAYAAMAAVVLFLVGHLRDHTTVVATWAMLVAVVAPARARLQRLGAAVVVATVIPLLVGIGPFGLDLLLHHGDLSERRENNAEGAETAFVGDRELRELRDAMERRQGVETEVAAAEGEAGRLDAAALEARRRAAAEAAARAEAERLRAEAERLEEQARLAMAEARALAAKLREAREAELAAARAADIAPTESLADAFGDGGQGTSSSLRQLPIGLRVMTVDPLPWASISNDRVRMAQAEHLVWYPLLVLAAIGLWASRRRLGPLLFPVLLCGGVWTMYALSEGNFGTAFRHRGETVWAVVVLAAAGAEALIRQREGQSAVIPSD